MAKLKQSKKKTEAMIIKRAHGHGNPKMGHTQSTLRIIKAKPCLTNPNKTTLSGKRDWKKDPLWLPSFFP